MGKTKEEKKTRNTRRKRARVEDDDDVIVLDDIQDFDDDEIRIIKPISTTQSDIQPLLSQKIDTFFKRNSSTICRDVHHNDYDWLIDKNNDLWIDTHHPKSLTELAVHKKKVNEVETWLNNAFSYKKPRILLLTGPSGCGKTATVQVLSQEMGFDIHEWSNPLNLKTFIGNESISEWESASTLFDEFIRNSSKSQSLFSKDTKKIILVEDHLNLTNEMVRQKFNASVRGYLRSDCVHPLVFIISEYSYTERNSTISCNLFLHSNITYEEIKFNPIAPTFIEKAIARIIKEETHKCSKEYLKNLSKNCEGDIRCAINSLQFYSRTRTKGNIPCARDSTTLIFNALGKILHNKRSTKVIHEELPSYFQHYIRKYEIDFDPEEVIENTHLDASLVNMYLFENYMNFFEDFDDIDRASDYASHAEVLSKGSSEYSSSVFARGLLFSKTTDTLSKFQPLRKPRNLNMKAISENSQMLWPLSSSQVKTSIHDTMDDDIQEFDD